MYHTLASQTTKDLVESNAPLKQLAREVCHKFNVQVMTHDPDLMDQAIRSPYSDPAAQARYERAHMRLLLTKENGLPFCSIRTEWGEDKSGNEATRYIVTSPMIHKDKGRGSDRMTRESIKIKSLMKTLENDYDHNSGLLSLEYLLNQRIDLFRHIRHGAENATKMGYVDRLSFDYKTCEALLKQMFEGQALNDTVVDYMKKKYDEHMNVMSKIKQVDEICDRFLTECYLVLRYQFCPAVVAKVTLEKHVIGNDFKVKVNVHDGVKCYPSMEALSADNSDLAISLKMFTTRNGTEGKNMSNKGADLFPIVTELPWGMDKFDSDIDTLSHSSSFTGFNNFAYFQALVTPVIAHE